MQPDISRIAPFLFAALIVWIVYRRFRRNFGQQPLRPVAMRVRIAILLVVGCLLLPAALRGTIIGAVLAVFGVLFLGRIVYRLLQVYGQMHAGQLGAMDVQNRSPLGMINSPLTFGMYFVLMGYYVCYYAIVLQNSKSVAADAAGA